MTKVTVTCTLIIDQIINHSNFTHVGKDTFHKEARPEVLKLWGPHPGGGALLVLWWEASGLYERHTYFKRNMGAT
jgi:hypothetical protein